jgi:tartrate dehydratase beta subunit/fumarate hydratase class I family protein
VIIRDQNGSRLAVLFDTRDEAQCKVEELQSAGFETCRVNIINYNTRVEHAPGPPPSGSAGPATAPKSERMDRLARDLDLLLATFGRAEKSAITADVVFKGKTLLVLQPGSQSDRASRIFDRDEAA